MMCKDTQNGRSMVEMMGYLMVLMGVIIAMGRIVSSAFDNHKYSTASLQLTELINAMVKASAIDYDYSEVVNKIQTADGAKELAPNTYRVVGTKIYHAFGGTVSVSTTDDNTKLVVTYNGLSKKQCVELAMKDWRKNQYADLFSVKVNDTYWYWVAYGDKDGSSISLDEGECSGTSCALPMRRSALTGTGDVAGQCTDSRSNTITWTFN